MKVEKPAENFLEETMMPEKILEPTRIRTTEGSFGFIPHRFVRGGFWESCSVWELILYFFLSMAGNRFGVSFYGKEKLPGLCKMSLGQLEESRAGLEVKDLIACDGVFLQVLSLPRRPVVGRRLPAQNPTSLHGPVSVSEAIHAFTLELERRNR